MSNPEIAIIGASHDRAKFGNRAVRAYLRRGWRVYPVNPKGEPIEGLETFRKIRDVPASQLQRISLYLPPAVGLELVEDIAIKGCRELWLNPGAASGELVAAAERLGLHVIEGCSIVDIGETP